MFRIFSLSSIFSGHVDQDPLLEDDEDADPQQPPTGLVNQLVQHSGDRLTDAQNLGLRTGTLRTTSLLSQSDAEDDDEVVAAPRSSPARSTGLIFPSTSQIVDFATPSTSFRPRPSTSSRGPRTSTSSRPAASASSVVALPLTEAQFQKFVQFRSAATLPTTRPLLPAADSSLPVPANSFATSVAQADHAPVQPDEAEAGDQAHRAADPTQTPPSQALAQANAPQLGVQAHVAEPPKGAGAVAEATVANVAPALPQPHPTLGNAAQPDDDNDVQAGPLPDDDDAQVDVDEAEEDGQPVVRQRRPRKKKDEQFPTRFSPRNGKGVRSKYSDTYYY